MIWNIFEISVSLFQSFIVCRFICAFMGMDFSKPRSRVYLLLGTLFFAALVIVMNCFTDYEGLLSFLYIVHFFLFALLCTKGSVLKKCLFRCLHL